MIDIIFMGTPGFAVPSLNLLANDGFFNIKGVITQPDRPAGRGQRITSPPVKKEAEKRGIPVYQPINKRELVEIIGYIRPDCIVVVAYGMILPEGIIKIPRYGSINLHASLLPKYRGPSPIERAILSGEKVTGNTVILINERMDEGDILSKEEVEIEEEDNRVTLSKKLSLKGAYLLLQTLKGWISGNIKPIPQDNSEATYAPLITKEELRICWKADAKSVKNRVRAFYPDAYTYFKGKPIKLLNVSIVEGEGSPGEIIDDRRLIVACGKGAIEIKELISPKGKRIKGEDFMRGYRNIKGEVLQ